MRVQRMKFQQNNPKSTITWCVLGEQIVHGKEVYGWFWFTWPAAISIPWNKRNYLNRNKFPQTLFWSVSIWFTNMAAITSYENHRSRAFLDWHLIWILLESLISYRCHHSTFSSVILRASYFKTLSVQSSYTHTEFCQQILFFSLVEERMFS